MQILACNVSGEKSWHEGRCIVLIRFRAHNFRSLKDEQELSLVASSLKDSPDCVNVQEAERSLGVGNLRNLAPLRLPENKK